jgi:L-ribulose-5-phosphate 3-epimerase
VPKLEIGALVHQSDYPFGDFRKLTDLGLHSCQYCSWKPELWTREVAEAVLEASAAAGVQMTTLWAGYPGPKAWNFIEGPKTIGLVPIEYRRIRTDTLKKAAVFASWLKLPSMTTHAGFIPENPNDPDYTGTVEALREIAQACKDLGLEFWFETGQETPVTLLRTMEDIGTGNLGVNLDPANLILYGKGNPIDALDVLGRFVRGVHAKDGLYPTDGRNLGNEVPLGEGKVNFPALIARLKELGYTGALTIEREIEGEKQVADIKKAIELLRSLV